VKVCQHNDDDANKFDRVDKDGKHHKQVKSLIELARSAGIFPFHWLAMDPWASLALPPLKSLLCSAECSPPMGSPVPRIPLFSCAPHPMGSCAPSLGSHPGITNDPFKCSPHPTQSSKREDSLIWSQGAYPLWFKFHMIDHRAWHGDHGSWEKRRVVSSFQEYSKTGCCSWITPSRLGTVSCIQSSDGPS